MMRPMIRRAVAVATILCSCGYAAADSKPAGPSLYDSWAKCKPGATTKVESSTEAMGQTTKMTITTKLLEVTPEKATVETQMTIDMMGQKMAQPATKTEIKAKQETPATPKMPDGTEIKASKPVTGKETVTVNGKSIDCTTSEVEAEHSGMKVKTKTWTSPEVPGTVVKMTSTSEGQMASKTTMTLVEYTDGK